MGRRNHLLCHRKSTTEPKRTVDAKRTGIESKILDGEDNPGSREEGV